MAISRSILLLVAGIVAGLMNAILGGRTIVTFPAFFLPAFSSGIGFAITAVMSYKEIVRG